jgi:polyisoprenoid-binding protein YceI
MSASSHQDVLLPVGPYRITPARSTVSFTTWHFFGLGRVTGSFALLDGDIQVADPLDGSSVTARAAADSFTTGIGMRDWQVRSPMFLHARKHPHLTFESTATVRTSDGRLIRGLLTVRGTTAPVDLTVLNAHADDRSLAIDAEGRVDRYAHGVTLMKGVAARYLDIRITIRAERV